MPAIRTFERAWPVCPRPFVDETFGSWFGRVATRYRMDVDHLAESAGVELELGRDCFGWLTMPPPRGRTLQRLAALARVEPITLANLASGGPVAAAGPTIWFCCRCFFLNPLEVESPYWHAAWLAMEPAYCPVHNVAPERLPLGVLAKARNIAKLLDYVGSHRTTLFSWEVATRGPRWRR